MSSISVSFIDQGFSLSRGCVDLACTGVIVGLISRLNVSGLSRTVERVELTFGERLGGWGVDRRRGGVDRLSHHVQVANA